MIRKLTEDDRWAILNALELACKQFSEDLAQLDDISRTPGHPAHMAERAAARELIPLVEGQRPHLRALCRRLEEADEITILE